MFTPSQIKSRVQVKPFRPLRIVTSSGEAYEVYHPDMVWVGTRDIHVGIGSADDPSTYEDVSRISLLHITAIEDLPVKTGKNGAKKNGKK